MRADQPGLTLDPSDIPDAGPQDDGALFRLDTGWLFMIPGLAIICATLLIPAYDDLTDAQYQRSQALALEKYRSDRLRSYTTYLDAVRTNDETVLLSLAATQMNLVPAGTEVLIAPAQQISDLEASPFPGLEPMYTPPPPPKRVDSLLRRLAINDTTRLWVLAAGMLCMLVGLLPASRHGDGGDGGV